MPGDLNIGKLLRTNKRLARELSRMDGIFNAIHSAIIVIDPAGYVQFANDFAKRILPISDGACIFKLLAGIESDIRACSENDDTFIRREFEVDYPEQRLLSAQIVPFDFGEGRGTFAIILNDITKEKFSAEEKIESEKIASVLELASGVAHELGNPLNSINIHLQLAKRRLEKIGRALEKLPKKPTRSAEAFEDAAAGLAEIGGSIDVCSDEVKRLDAIIENFLKALRPMRPDMSECDPITPLAETLSLLDREISDLGIAVYVNAHAPVPKVYADKNLLKQLYFNIIKNAMEAMSAGGSITIEARGNDDYVNISFSDTGCGISGSDMSRLFQPYFTTKPDGHGLGMMIIQAIVRAHGGKIDVDSAVGKGTKITVAIPRKERRVKMLVSEG